MLFTLAIHITTFFGRYFKFWINFVTDFVDGLTNSSDVFMTKGEEIVYIFYARRSMVFHFYFPIIVIALRAVLKLFLYKYWTLRIMYYRANYHAIFVNNKILYINIYSIYVLINNINFKIKTEINNKTYI
jgi:hypothetical protein